MSQENVEIVRKAFEAWQQGGVEALLKVLDPDIEWTLRPDFPDAGIFRGYDEIRALFGRFDETLVNLTVEPLEFIAAGEHVVVPLNWAGRGKASGIEVAERQGETWAFTVRAGKVAVVTEYRRRAEALEAAGLAE